MQTAWSAKRTCRPAWSASEYTATVRMPSSLQAQMTRSAISPRLAMRTFLNIDGGSGAAGGASPSPAPSALRPDGEQRVAELHGLAGLPVDAQDLSRHLGLDLVHQLHGFDDAQ